LSDREDIQALREAIEAVDARLIGLLEERMALVERVSRWKLESAAPFRDLAREEHVILRVRALAAERGIDAHAVEDLYRRILAMSIAHQQAYVSGLSTVPLRVAYQGVEGSYSHLAAQARYGGRAGGVLLTGHDTFAATAHAVRSGTADVALLPIENTTAGSVHEVLDLLAEGGLAINAEVVSRIEHCLLALPGARLDELRVVRSHPQALAQCATFLRALPGVRAEEDYDTAGAARKVREGGDRAVGAIAPEAAARTYGLDVLARGIQSQEGNFTRFVEVARDTAPCPPDAACKTSLLVTLDHRPGALSEALGALAARGVNLTKLESRPVPGEPFHYRFHLDLEGHAASASVAAALADLESRVRGLRILGTYPRAAQDEARLPGAGRVT
jgi:chorismate mutase/prephenate dehydratase